MALFNITNKEGIEVDFRTSNINIHIDTEVLDISQILITEEQWLGNL